MRSARAPFMALILALAALTPFWSGPVHAGPVPDTTGILTPWHLVPAHPCVDDSVFMVVQGFVDTPCDSFLGAEAITPLLVRIRRVDYVDRRCPEPSEFFPVPVELGRFTEGAHMGIVELETTEVRNDGSRTVQTRQVRFDFVVAAECSIPPPPPPPPPGSLPFVDTVGTEPPRPCATRPTSLVLKGHFLDGCGQVIDAVVHDAGHVELTLKPDVLPDTACVVVRTPWRQDFALGLLPAGPHRTEITLHVIRRDSTATGFVRETYGGAHAFFVAVNCDSIPPPPNDSLPYVEGIIIDRDGECGVEPPCPGDSIQFRVFGTFPNDCYELRRIDLIPSPLDIYPPPPPTVRIIVDNGCCLGRVCPTVPVAWVGSVTMPPQRPGDYRLNVQLAEVCCSVTYPPGELHQTVVPFTVADSCDVMPPCLTVNFAPGPGDGSCTARIATGQPAELIVMVRPSVALAGLQGVLRVDPPALRITSIEPFDTAEGMLIDWTPTDDGARFVLFARSGAPIPPYTAIGNGWAVLRVVVEHVSRGAPPPPRTVVTLTEVLGSDIDGSAVRLCPPPPCVDARLAPAFAVICGEQECDWNADGLLDVRDLVLMINCINSRSLCMFGISPSIDCDGDTTLTLVDIMCCARTLLHKTPCEACTLDTVRPAPGVAVSFGTPEERDGGIDLPVHIAGADQLGGAMLTLEVPLDRYDVSTFEVAPGGNWLALHEVRNGRIALGMIALRRETLDEARFTLRLARRAGQPGGGEVAAVAGEFSGRDGVALEVNLGRPSQTLPGGATVALSRNQPNPFSVETAFTVDLAAPGDVVVGVYDLRGRAVAQLHRAPLAAGPHVFHWDGRRTDGSLAPNGVYFYQVRVEGKTLARKLILMRGN